MSQAEHFSRFLDADPERIHFAAHSHHPWPDITFEAHTRAWLDAAEHMDDKWGSIFEDLMPRLSAQISSHLGLADPSTIVFAPNTHSLLNRLFSCLDPPVRVLSTDAEFHSFARQSRRWEEAGLAIIDRVPAEPFDTFPERFTMEARSGAHDLIYFSHVHFDSGYVVPEIDRIVSSVSEQRAFVVIDGYHSFMALPVDLASIQERAFFLAGGYKYAMAGEGACFMHCPPGYGPRPVDTGWYAGFGQLESGVYGTISYADDGSRFAGATFDPSGLYRLDAVLEWLRSIEMGPREIHEYVGALQAQFLEGAPEIGELLPPRGVHRGNFLTFRSDRAPTLYEELHQRSVVTDHRRDRLRIGFGIYQTSEDVRRLLSVLGEIAEPD